MKRNLLSAYLYDEEYEKIQAIATETKWPASEVCSFYVRRGMKNYNFNNTREFNDELYERLIESQLAEYKKTPAFSAEVEKAVKKELEAENVRPGESS